MLINLESAKNEPGKAFKAHFCEVPQCEEYPIEYELSAPVSVETNYTFKGGSVFVNGEFTAVLKVCCSRCLKDMEYCMQADFDEKFALKESDDVSYTYAEDMLYLDKLILDKIMFELPARFLCKPDCKGLCPQCGADLNVAPCGCNILKTDNKKMNPFSKLEGMFDNTEEV